MKVKSESEVAQLGPTLSNPMDCSLPGSSVHGIFQAGVLEWGAIDFLMAYWENNLKKTKQNRVDTCISLTDSLCYTPETNTTL